MNIEKVLKCLSNETRKDILISLKDPSNFEPQSHLQPTDNYEGGICVGTIQRRYGISQSTISGFMNQLENAELVECRKIRQWTYYRRREDKIKEFLSAISEELK